MKYWYDTEFYEDGERIHLISIGIVAEDGRELYSENAQFDWSIVPEDHWIQENVRPHLQGPAVEFYKHEIAAEVKTFICENPMDWKSNKLYGYYSAYDHVVLAQLFGRMVDMPKGMPWFTFDLKQMIEADPHRLGNLSDKVPHYGTEHNALEDARWNKLLYERIIEWKQGVY
jgi:hypothetical protein